MFYNKSSTDGTCDGLRYAVVPGVKLSSWVVAIKLKLISCICVQLCVQLVLVVQVVRWHWVGLPTRIGGGACQFPRAGPGVRSLLAQPTITSVSASDVTASGCGLPVTVPVAVPVSGRIMAAHSSYYRVVVVVLGLGA